MKSVTGSRAMCQPGPSWAELTAELDELQETGRWLPGPATMLDVLGRSDFEADHERLIAWLLNPGSAHNLGPAMLGAMLERLRKQSAISDTVPRAELSRARVRTQVVRASSRPDIVVEMPTRTLVIEIEDQLCGGVRADHPSGERLRQRSRCSSCLSDTLRCDLTERLGSLGGGGAIAPRCGRRSALRGAR
jgi:hypothetical protein